MARRSISTQDVPQERPIRRLRRSVVARAARCMLTAPTVIKAIHGQRPPDLNAEAVSERADPASYSGRRRLPRDVGVHADTRPGARGQVSAAAGATSSRILS